MKKLVINVVMGAFVFLMMAGADFRLSPAAVKKFKKTCIGYTVIEVDKGIDCNGDTISLVKSHGYFQFVAVENAKRNAVIIQ